MSGARNMLVLLYSILSAHPLEKKERRNGKKEQMDWLVSHFDLDHDGKINYEEFLLLLQKLRSAEVEQDSSGSLTEKKKHSTPTRSRREKAITTPTKQNTGLLWDYGSDRYNTHSPTKEEKISKKIAIIKEFNAKQYEEFLRKDEEAHNQYMNTHHHNELQRQREDYQLIENLNIHSEDPSLLLQRFVKEINGQCENGQSTLRNLFKKWDRDHDNVWGKEDVRYALEATLGADVLSRMSSDLFNSFYGTLDIKNDGKVKFFELVNILGSINCEEDHEHIYTDEGNQEAHRNEHLDSKRHEGVHNQDIVPPSTPSRLQTLSSNKISPGTRKVYEDVHFSPSRGVQDDMKNYQEIERLENKLNNEIDKMNKLKSPLRVIPDSIRSPGGSRLPSSSIHIRTSPSSDRKKTEEWNSINGANSSSSSKFTLSKENLKVDGSHSVADIMTDKAIRATADRIGEALHMEHIPAFKFFSNTLHLNLHEEISVDNFILAMSKINILLTKDQAASLMLVARKLSEIDSKDGSTGNREVDSLSEHFGSLYINKQYNITITAKDFVKFLSYI